MMSEQNGRSCEVLHLFTMPGKLLFAESRAYIFFCNLIKGVRIMVGSISPQKLPLIIPASETEIAGILFGEILRVDLFDKAKKGHSPRVVIMITWNAIEEDLSFGNASKFINKASNIILVLFRSTRIVDIPQMQDDVNTAFDHHILQ